MSHNNLNQEAFLDLINGFLSFIRSWLFQLWIRCEMPKQICECCWCGAFAYNVHLFDKESFFDSFGCSLCLAFQIFRYANRDRLSPEHERAIVEMLLPYHPEVEKKIGCGIDYIMVCIMLSRFGKKQT